MNDEALRELMAAPRKFVRSAYLETTSAKSYRQIVSGLSQQLFDKYANEAEKREQREEQQYEAELAI